MPLNEAQVKSAKPVDKPCKLADGHGLFLYVTPKGSKLWRVKYRSGGKEKLLALGRYPEVNLKQARDRRDEARALLKEGKDPLVERKRDKRKAQLRSENAFEIVTREFVEQQKARWSSKYATNFLRRMELDIFPDLGARPIEDITPLELLDVIRKMERRGATFLAHRVLQLCGQVFRFGVVTGRCEKNVGADLHGALIPHVAKPQISIRPEELPNLLCAIKGYDGDKVTLLGLQILALTSVRTIELIAANWTEFDFTQRLWFIPASRTKMVSIRRRPPCGAPWI